MKTKFLSAVVVNAVLKVLVLSLAFYLGWNLKPIVLYLGSTNLFQFVYRNWSKLFYGFLITFVVWLVWSIIETRIANESY